MVKLKFINSHHLIILYHQLIQMEIFNGDQLLAVPDRMHFLMSLKMFPEILLAPGMAILSVTDQIL